MFKKLDQFICAFAEWISNSNIDVKSQKYKWVSRLAVGFPALMALCILLIGVIPPIKKEADVRGVNLFSVPFQHYEYITSYEDFGPDQLQKSEQLMWQNQNKRDMLPHSSKLDTMHGGTYWIGYEVSPAQMKKAIETKAHILVLGYLYGEWQLFIDSVFIKSGGSEQTRRPVSVDIPVDLLNKKNNLRIAVRIRHTMKEFYPDVLFFTGFTTEQEYLNFVNEDNFTRLVGPSIAFGINFSLGVFFLAMWLCGVRKQELAAFAAFGLFQAASQASRIPFTHFHMGALDWHRLNFVSTIYEVLIILWLGFSISRIRSASVLITMGVLLAAPWAVFFTSASVNEIFYYVWKMSQNAPLAYFIAAFFCFGQARFVSKNYRLNLEDSLRVHKLYLSSAALMIIGFWLHYGNTQYIDYHIFNTMLLMSLAVIVIHEYRKQDLFVRRAPLSKYHQLAKMPERLPCILVNIDLKNSEALYSYGADRGVGGSYVAEIISKFYDMIVKHSGEVLQTEGDSISFFFETDEKSESDNLKIITTLLSELDHLLKTHLQQKIATTPDFPVTAAFRAAIETGAITPVWQHFEGRDVAGWQQASDSKVFVDAARLMEAEAKVGNNLTSSFVVNADKIKITELKSRNELVTIKHGRQIHVSLVTL